MRVFVLDKNKKPLDERVIGINWTNPETKPLLRGETSTPMRVRPIYTDIVADPCTSRRARLLLNFGRAAVFRRYPFTIILTDRTLEDSITHEHQLKLDPGAKTTGIAILQGNIVVWAAELTHRGFQIRNELTNRRQKRLSRRNRKTRYRHCKCPSLKKGKKYPVPKQRRSGWLPPSLKSRIYNIETWVKRIRRYCPISGISQELVRFDTQKLMNPALAGNEYQPS